jgi:hypothetical protein
MALFGRNTARFIREAALELDRRAGKVGNGWLLKEGCSLFVLTQIPPFVNH